MSGWWICPPNGQVCVDDCVEQPIDCSSVDPTIYLIRWWDTSGEVLFNHDSRLPVRQPFTDLTPYISLFDKWMAAAQSSPPEPSPPITLAQAKQVKASMVDALFASKRQSPVAYLGYLWDASDAATSAMSDEIAAVSGTDAINSATGALATSVNAAFASMASGTNSALTSVANATSSGIRDSMANYNAGMDNVIVGQYNQNAAILQQLVSATTPTDNAHYGSTPPYTAPTIVAPIISAPSVGATPATGPPITWPPIGAPPVTLQYAQFTALLSVMTSRRNILQQTRTAHKNNIAGLTSVDAVVAYDIKGGW